MVNCYVEEIPEGSGPHNVSDVQRRDGAIGDRVRGTLINASADLIAAKLGEV